jgi:hypothetical protein
LGDSMEGAEIAGEEGDESVEGGQAPERMECK